MTSITAADGDIRVRGARIRVYYADPRDGSEAQSPEQALIGLAVTDHEGNQAGAGLDGHAALELASRLQRTAEAIHYAIERPCEGCGAALPSGRTGFCEACTDAAIDVF
jgi:hypothetical protein